MRFKNTHFSSFSWDKLLKRGSKTLISAVFLGINCSKQPETWCFTSSHRINDPFFDDLDVGFRDGDEDAGGLVVELEGAAVALELGDMLQVGHEGAMASEDAGVGAERFLDLGDAAS